MSRRNGTGRLGVGVIGLGYWGPNLVRNLHELDGVEVVAMSDLDAEALAKVGARYPAVKRMTRAEELIADPEIEAVAIATPVGTHYHLARAVLEAGKHVFVEKPLASSNAEATELGPTLSSNSPAQQRRAQGDPPRQLSRILVQASTR